VATLGEQHHMSSGTRLAPSRDSEPHDQRPQLVPNPRYLDRRFEQRMPRDTRELSSQVIHCELADRRDLERIPLGSGFICVSPQLADQSPQVGESPIELNNALPPFRTRSDLAGKNR